MKLSFTSAVANVDVGNEASLQRIPALLDKNSFTFLIFVYLAKYDSTLGVRVENVTKK